MLNSGGPAGFPQGRGDTVVVFSDTVSYQRGKHALRFGTELRRFHNNNFSENVGNMVFNSWNDFALGYANTFTTTLGGVVSGIRTTGFGLFVQDNYRFASNLTFELGLRWDLNTTPSEVNNKFSVFDPAKGALVRVGTEGLDEVYETRYRYFGPRVGFAWDPFGDGKTSLRGGYGLFFDQPVTNTVTGLATRRANVIGNWKLSRPDPDRWFDTAAFCSPGAAGCTGPAVFGNLGRNVVIGPGFNNFDFSILKVTKLRENLRMQFRTEIFDLFNHPNFGQPGRIVGTSSFGKILNTRFSPGDSGSARQIQFAVKFLF